MTPDYRHQDDVRKTVERIKLGDDPYDSFDVIRLTRFADAVLNPPAEVAALVRRRVGYDDSCSADGPEFDATIADWIVKLLAPAAKETP